MAAGSLAKTESRFSNCPRLIATADRAHLREAAIHERVVQSQGVSLGEADCGLLSFSGRGFSQESSKNRLYLERFNLHYNVY